MRSIFYVAFAVAVFARNHVVAAFTNADPSQILSKPTPDFATDVVTSSDSRIRFLRGTGPDEGNLVSEDEERTKYGSLTAIIQKLEEKSMHQVADILKNAKDIHTKNLLKAAFERDQITKEEFEAAKNLLKLSKGRN